MIDCFLLTTDCVVGWMLSLANSYAPQNLSTCKKESTKPAKWGWIDREISWEDRDLHTWCDDEDRPRHRWLSPQTSKSIIFCKYNWIWRRTRGCSLYSRLSALHLRHATSTCFLWVSWTCTIFGPRFRLGWPSDREGRVHASRYHTNLVFQLIHEFWLVTLQYHSW